MSGADTAQSMIYTCLHLYVLTSVHFGRNSRNHSRIVLEHTVYLGYDIHMVLGHFGHGHFGLGLFGLDILATDVSATQHAKGGRFGHNHKFLGLGCVHA